MIFDTRYAYKVTVQIKTNQGDFVPGGGKKTIQFRKLSITIFLTVLMITVHGDSG